jgi:hypothetical protein
MAQVTVLGWFFNTVKNLSIPKYFGQFLEQMSDSQLLNRQFASLCYFVCEEAVG